MAGAWPIFNLIIYLGIFGMAGCQGDGSLDTFSTPCIGDELG